MDIDVLNRQVQELVAWKKRVEPMLADALVEYEKYQARRAPAEVEAEADRKAAAEQGGGRLAAEKVAAEKAEAEWLAAEKAEAERIAEEVARKAAEQNPTPPTAPPPATPPA